MSRGPYDDLADFVLRGVQGRLVFMLVVNGGAGSGFAISTVSPDGVEATPKLLRDAADQIEHMIEKQKEKISDESLS